MPRRGYNALTMSRKRIIIVEDERDMADLVTSPRVEEFAALKTDLPAACRDCEFLSMCWGGCPKHHRPIGRDPARTNHFCEGYKVFFKRALPELRRIAEYIKRGELPPTAGAVAAQKAKAPGAAPPGRNDPCPCGSGRKFKACCGRK